MKAPRRHRSLLAIFAFAAVALVAGTSRANAPAKWIGPPGALDPSTATACYFRKTFAVGEAERAVLEISASVQYELFINGRRVGTGNDRSLLDRYDIKPFLVSGPNTIGVKVSGDRETGPTLAARVFVKERGGADTAHSSDASSRTSTLAIHRWNTTGLDETGWQAASVLGGLGEVVPWEDGVSPPVAADEPEPKGRGRFRVMPEFRVQWVIDGEKAGSLIAMTFNEQGNILASREDGPILLIRDDNEDGAHETVSVYCDKVKNCQGLLSLNGRVFATADGRDGPALYRISDDDRDGKADRVETLLKFQGKKMGEHGPHGMALGPDGLIYLMVGNLSSVGREVEPTSPYMRPLDVDLNQPKIEDPTGHAVGIKAPGGVVLRFDADGQFVEQVAGGLRNPYDLAFNRGGDLFTYDADMETDIGLPWYRPNRVCHIVPGAEFGWRSGWSKWPVYYHDSLPSVLDMGPGSPTGMVVYNHHMYPMRFQNALFAGDWSQGQIQAIRMERDGATYRAKSEVFLEGTPLNVTDLDVGPDGWLYFCTGGRTTEGGIYRIVWTGSVPPSVSDMGIEIEQALRQPQPDSAWGRQNIARVKRDLGDRWATQLEAAATSSVRTPRERVRALDLMQLFGPFPRPALLLALSEDRAAEVRIKATKLLGLHPDPTTNDRLIALVTDEDPAVRRAACESLLLAGQRTPTDLLFGLLADRDRHVAYAARQLLARQPKNNWIRTLVREPRTRVFLQGAPALFAVQADREMALSVIERCVALMQGDIRDPDVPAGFISDENFTDMLRVVELALIHGKLTADDVPGLRAQLAREYPSRDAIINRELVRILVYLDEPSIRRTLVAQLRTDIGHLEKLHLLGHIPFLKQSWTTQEKLDLLKFYEAAHVVKGGKGISSYLDRFTRRLTGEMNDEEQRLVLNRGARWPRAALAVLAGLPPDPGESTLVQLERLDRELGGVEGKAARNLQIGIVAVLGRSGTDSATRYLRQIFAQDPERRAAAAVGLAQNPSPENWPLLVEALPVLDGSLAMEVLRQLRRVDLVPEHPESIRQAILCGARLKEHGDVAIALLSHWTDEQVHNPGERPETAIEKWQDWFEAKYPDQPVARLPEESDGDKWTYVELLSYLNASGAAEANAHRGAVVFEKAQCAKCHRYGDFGEPLGPDLTTLSRRFQTRDMLQSVLFPSHTISDQYASKKILATDGRVYTGMVSKLGDGTLVVLQSDGTKTTLDRDAVEEIAPSRVSSMPEKLLDPLSLEEIADLFAFLNTPPRTNITSRRDGVKR